MEIADDSGTVALVSDDNLGVAAATAAALERSLASGIAAALLWCCEVPVSAIGLSAGRSLLVGRQGSEIAVTEFMID
jgi:hypothetical protein